jgi:cyclohexanecarboxylate-CoA ligase
MRQAQVEPIQADSFPELLAGRAAITPDVTILLDEYGGSMSAAEFAQAVRCTVADLDARGVGPGTTVAWQLPNVCRTMVLFMALAHLGARQVPLLLGFRERELTALLGPTAPSILITPGSWRGFDHAALGARVVESLGIATHIVELAEPTAEALTIPPAVDSQVPRFLYATSGSTGKPKLVRHGSNSLLAGWSTQARLSGIVPGDVVATVTSLAHIGGAMSATYTLSIGCTTLLIDRFDPAVSAATMRQHGTTVILAAPAALTALVAEQRRHPDRLVPLLRFCVGGASVKPPNLHRDVRDTLGGRGLLMSYGMTEVGSMVTPQLTDSDEQLEHTLGAVMPGLDMRIVDDQGQPVEPGEVGEIRVKGPMVCDGYLDEQATLDAFDDDGYLRTGDLALRRVSDGYLKITGRIKDVIIRKGENISPKEVEDVLYELTQIREVVVVGLPDAAMGELLCAAAVLRGPDDRLTIDDVRTHCIDSGLMIQKVPEKLVIIDDFPRTVLGKVDKGALRVALGSTSAPSGAE